MLKSVMNKENENDMGSNFNINDNFELMQVIGSGNFGQVHLVRQKEDGMLFALKAYNKYKLIMAKMEKQLFHEVNHHSLLNHPHITVMFDYFYSNQKVYFLLEYCENGSLYDELKRYKYKRFTEDVAAKYMYEVSDGLKYCHSHKFLHGDLKPENVLLDVHGNAKITDFGLSCPLDHNSLHIRGFDKGTLEYMAPELLNESFYCEKIDHWSLGVMCFEFIVGSTAFSCKHRASIVPRILSLDLRFPKVVTTEAQDLILKLLKFEAEDRLPLDNVMGHRWISCNLEKTRRM